jgi:Leucine-rich repeat (LRR) protein
LEECRFYNCGLERLIIKNCPNLKSLSIINNLLINLEFLKGLNRLTTLEIDGNEQIIAGIEYFPDSLKEFSCEGTELFKTLEQHGGD